VDGSFIRLTSPFKNEVKEFQFNNVYKKCETKKLYDENCFKLLVKVKKKILIKLNINF
jgi:hypothetical protein